MARGHQVFALSVLPPVRPINFVFSTPPTSLHGCEWNLVQMLYQKCRSACGEIIHVRQILAELWPLTIFTHFSLSSQLLLHLCMDLNETWQGCCTTSSLHGFEWNLAGMLHHKSRSACGEIIYVRQISQELQPLTLRIFAHFSLSSQLLLHLCMDLNETWQGCCSTSSMHGFEWNLAGMLHHKSRSACGEIIYVRQISQELQPLTLRIFALFNLSSQLSNSSYIFAWIWMKLGRDVAPQV